MDVSLSTLTDPTAAGACDTEQRYRETAPAQKRPDAGSETFLEIR
jgi:hypothetical protein